MSLLGCEHAIGIKCSFRLTSQGFHSHDALGPYQALSSSPKCQSVTSRLTNWRDPERPGKLTVAGLINLLDRPLGAAPH